MRDLQARAGQPSVDLARGQRKPNRAAKQTLRKLSGTTVPVVHREAILTMFHELYDERGSRQINKMTGWLTTLLMNTAAAQAQPPIAALPEGDEAIDRTPFVRPKRDVAV